MRETDCFVCGSDEHPLYRVCRCNTAIHRDCFQRLVTVPSHESNCPVCKAPYHISVEWKWRIAYHPLCLKIATMAVIAITSGIASLVQAEQSMASKSWERKLLQSTIASFSAASLCVVAGILRVYIRDTGKVCCVWFQRTAVRTVKLESAAMLELGV